MKTNTTTLLLFGAVMTASLQAAAQNDEGYLYGEVSMINGDRYKGQLRWGSEEAFWDDMFNATKNENPFPDYLDRDDMEENGNRKSKNTYIRWNDRSGFLSLWGDRGNIISISGTSSRQFACRFGDIAELRPIGRDLVELTMRNGEKQEVGGNTNDIGTKIKVYDDEIGIMDLSWDRIEKIRFLDGPKKLSNKMGEPLYGTLTTLKGGKFTGFIQWDNDECLSTDKLDGQSENGKMAIEFGNIASISPDGRGSRVTLRSGRNLYLYGSNDVDSRNRGIVVKNPEWGRVLVNWKNFDRLDFSDDIPGSGLAFKSFDKQKPIAGRLKTTDGESLAGLFAFDLDEYWNWEMLDGKDDGLEYQIPFQQIKSIKPKNYNYSLITLRSGRELILGETQDVTDRHDGVLVFKNSKDEAPVFVPWKKVEEFVFD